MTRYKKAILIGTPVVALVAFWGYQLSQSWSNLGQIVDSVNAPEPISPERAAAPEAENAVSVGALSGRASPEFPAADPNAPTSSSASPAELRQEIFELRRELSRVLIDDQELYASLDEMFEVEDEDLLRDNMQILRETFLSDNAVIE